MAIAVVGEIDGAAVGRDALGDTAIAVEELLSGETVGIGYESLIAVGIERVGRDVAVLDR